MKKAIAINLLIIFCLTVSACSKLNEQGNASAFNTSNTSTQNKDEVECLKSLEKENYLAGYKVSLLYPCSYFKDIEGGTDYFYQFGDIVSPNKNLSVTISGVDFGLLQSENIENSIITTESGQILKYSIYKLQDQSYIFLVSSNLLFADNILVSFKSLDSKDEALKILSTVLIEKI